MAKKKKFKSGGKTTGDLSKIKASYIEPYQQGGKTPIYTSDKNDPRLQAYQDSLDLYNYTNLQHQLEPSWSVIQGNALQNLGVGQNSEFAKNQQKLFNTADSIIRNNPRIEWGTYGDPFADAKGQKGLREQYSKRGGNSPDIRSKNNVIKPANFWTGAAANHDYIKPVQPIIYQPEVKDEFQNRQSLLNIKNPSLSREQKFIRTGRLIGDEPTIPFSIIDDKDGNHTWGQESLWKEADLLQGSNQQLEFNPIPFKKGTYFTRLRQSQEQGNGSLTDYFDKKTGKLLGTYKSGGKLPMYLNAGEIEEPTFNIGDEGYNENLMYQGKKLGQIMDIQNPYNFDPSLTYSLQNYTGKNPTLTPEEQVKYDKYKKSLNKNSVNPQGYTNIQGGRSATDTFLTGLSNLPKAIQDPSNPANWAAVGDLPTTGAKAITSAIGAKKVNPRNAKYVADLTKQVQLEPYQMTYFDDQYGTMKNPITLAHGGGIPSKFNGKRHYEGGIPINTDITSFNANDMKVDRNQASLEVENNEYYVPNAEEGGKTENAFVLSDRKNVGWLGKSPSQHYEDITKAEFGISADKFNKNLNKRDKFIADNIKFLENKEAEQTENVVSKLTQNIQDGMLNLAHNVYMTQESIKKEKGMKNDLEQAKTGIKIKPSKKGTFKAQATKMGMGVQEAASKILNAPEGKYSAAMRKKANFAKNFAKEVGGQIPDEQVYPGMEMFMEHGGYLPKAKDGELIWDKISPELEQALKYTMGIEKGKPFKEELLHLSDNELFNVLKQIKKDNTLTTELYKQLADAGLSSNYFKASNIASTSTNNTQTTPFQTFTGVNPNIDWKTLRLQESEKQRRNKFLPFKQGELPQGYGSQLGLESVFTDFENNYGVKLPQGTNEQKLQALREYQTKLTPQLTKDYKLNFARGNKELYDQYTKSKGYKKSKDETIESQNFYDWAKNSGKITDDYANKGLWGHEYYNTAPLKFNTQEEYDKFLQDPDWKKVGNYFVDRSADPNQPITYYQVQQPTKQKQTPTSDTPSKINMDLTGTSKGKTNLPNIIPALRFKEPYLTTPPALFQEEPYLTQYRNPDLESALVEQRRLYSTLGKNLNPTQKANLAANMADKTNQLYGNYFNQVQQGKQAVDQFNAQTLAGVRGRNIARGDKFYTDWMQTLGNLGTQQLLDTQAANQDWANIQHEGRMANYASQIYNPEYIDYMQYANPALQKYSQTSNLDEKLYKVNPKTGNLELYSAKDKAKSGGKITKRFKKKK